MQNFQLTSEYEQKNTDLDYDLAIHIVENHLVDPCCSREEWVKLGTAMKSAGLDFEHFDRWSQGSRDQYDAKNCLSTWNGLKEDRCSIGHLVNEAKRQRNFDASAWTKEWHQQHGNLNGNYRSSRPRSIKQSPKPKIKPPVTLEKEIVLVNPIEVTKPVKIARPYGYDLEYIYWYSDTQFIKRIEFYNHEGKRIIPDGRKKNKDVKPYLVINGIEKLGKGDRLWSAYRLTQATTTKSEYVLSLEGEPCVDYGWLIGFPSVSLQGGRSEAETKVLAQKLKQSHKLPIFIPDNDDEGRNTVKRQAKIFSEMGLDYLVFELSSIWSNIPFKGDIKDWVKMMMGQGHTPEEIGQILADHLESSLSAGYLPDWLEIAEEKTETLENHNSHSKVVNHPNFTPIPQESLFDEIDSLIEEDLQQSQLTAKLNELSQKSAIPISEIRKIYNERVKESESEDSREDTAKELEALLKIDNYSVNLARYLPEDFVYPLTYIADLLGSNPLSMLTVLLPTVATLINPDTSLELIKTTRFYSKPILYTGLIGESGSAKSPTMRTILDPFKRLQKEADLEYKKALLQYQEDLKAWKQEKKDERGEEPTPPTPREYFINDATSEAIAIIQDNQPNSGLLLELDELSGLVKSANAYRGGKGTDAEKILSGRDGTGIKVNRASGKRLSNPRSTLSIVGGIQPDTLRQQMGDLRDSQGYWARFIWASVPVKEAKFPDDEPQIDVSNLLYGLYRKIQDYPATQYTLSDEAKKLYGDWFRILEKKKLDEPNQALRAVYSKFKGFTGDLALIINSIFNAWYEYDSPIVEADIMKTAIHLAKIYIGQIRLIYGEASIENGEISPILKKILDLSSRKGEITAKDVKSGVHPLRKESPDKIRQLFADLVQMGYGQLIGSGKRVRFTQRVEKVDKKLMEVDEGSTFSSTSQTQSVQEIQNSPNQKVEKVDAFFDASQKSEREHTDELTPKENKNTVDQPSTFINPDQQNSETQSGEAFQKVDEPSTDINCSSTFSTFEHTTESVQRHQIKVGDIIPRFYSEKHLENFTVVEVNEDSVLVSHPNWDKPKFLTISNICWGLMKK